MEKGQSYAIIIQPEEGWAVNSVMFDGEDVTNQVTDNVLTTSQLYADAQISVSFENSPAGTHVLSQTSPMKAFVDDSGQLCIDDTMGDEQVVVTNVEGQLLHRITSKGSRIIIPLAAQGIYVVSTKTKSIKVCF